VLGVLLVVLGVTGVFAYRMNQPQITAAVQAAPAKTSSNPPAPSEAHIRLDLLQNSDAEEAVGKRNLFQYRQNVPALPPLPQRGGKPLDPPLPTNVPPPTPVVTGPPPPPPPPPINLKYQALFVVTESPDGGPTAVLADESRHYNVKTGEILLGRYRIVSISESSVEVEDLNLNRRQTLPYVK
jgi:hypothetical protein